MFDKYFITYLQQFNRIALAVSGGADSMCLLHSYIAERCNLPEFVVINVNHNLRGKESDSDSEFVKQYCEKNNVVFKFFNEDINAFCKENAYSSVEQGARMRRKQIFNQLIKENIADRVLTAHHLDDQTESILMHIFRGSGINGLKGIPFDDGVLLRPFLQKSKAEIVDYITQNNVPYVVDSSNLCVDFTRNKLRQEIIPELNKLFGNVNTSLQRLSRVASCVADYTDKHCPTFENENGIVKVKLTDICERDFIAAEILARAVETIASRVDLTYEHIDMLYSLASGENGKKISLPWSVVAYKEYDCLCFSSAAISDTNQSFKSESSQPFNYAAKQSFKSERMQPFNYAAKQSFKSERMQPFEVDFLIGTLYIGNWIVDISFEDNGGLKCDFDTIKNSKLRYRKQGDSFSKFGGGRKSLGDFLTDKKVPARTRNTLIVAAKGSDILAVFPYEISSSVKITEHTERIAYIKAVERR